MPTRIARSNRLYIVRVCRCASGSVHESCELLKPHARPQHKRRQQLQEVPSQSHKEHFPSVLTNFPDKFKKKELNKNITMNDNQNHRIRQGWTSSRVHAPPGGAGNLTLGMAAPKVAQPPGTCVSLLMMEEFKN